MMSIIIVDNRTAIVSEHSASEELRISFNKKIFDNCKSESLTLKKLQISITYVCYKDFSL